MNLVYVHHGIFKCFAAPQKNLPLVGYAQDGLIMPFDPGNRGKMAVGRNNRYAFIEMKQHGYHDEADRMMKYLFFWTADALFNP